MTTRGTSARSTYSPAALREDDAGPRFSSAASLLQWLFAQRAVRAQSTDGAGGGDIKARIEDRCARLAGAALCWEAVTDERQRAALVLTHGIGLRPAQVADRLGESERTAGRLVGRGERIVVQRARELGLMGGTP